MTVLWPPLCIRCGSENILVHAGNGSWACTDCGAAGSAPLTGGHEPGRPNRHVPLSTSLQVFRNREGGSGNG